MSMVLSVTMTQIVSNLASLLQGPWHPGHPQSALYPLLLTDNMFPPDLLQGLVSLRAPDTDGRILRSGRPAGAALVNCAHTD